MLMKSLLTMSIAGMFSAFQPAHGAVVITNSGCTLLDGNGNFTFTDRDHAVITSSGHGKLTCKAKGLPNNTGRAVHWNFYNTGLLCNTPAGVTQKWSSTVSKSGNARLTCHVG